MKRLKSIVCFDLKKSFTQNADYKTLEFWNQRWTNWLYTITVRHHSNRANKTEQQKKGSKSCMFKRVGIIQWMKKKTEWTSIPYVWECPNICCEWRAMTTRTGIDIECGIVSSCCSCMSFYYVVNLCWFLLNWIDVVDGLEYLEVSSRWRSFVLL